MTIELDTGLKSLADSKSVIAPKLLEILTAVKNHDVSLLTHENSIGAIFALGKPNRIELHMGDRQTFWVIWASQKFYIAWEGNRSLFPTSNDIADMYEGIKPPRSTLSLDARYIVLEVDPLGDKMAYYLALFQDTEKFRGGPLEAYRFTPAKYAEEVIKAIVKMLSDADIYVGNTFIPRKKETFQGY